MRDPVAEATVTVLKEGTEVAALKTGKDGKFSFGNIMPGSYELRVQAEGFQTFQFPIVVTKPKSRCKRALEISLAVSGLYNRDVRIIKQ